MKTQPVKKTLRRTAGLTPLFWRVLSGNIVEHILSFSSFDLIDTHVKECTEDGVSFPRLHPHDCKHTWGSGRHLRQTEVRQRKPEGAADADQKPDLRTFLWNPFAASRG